MSSVTDWDVRTRFETEIDLTLEVPCDWDNVWACGPAPGRWWYTVTHDDAEAFCFRLATCETCRPRVEAQNELLRAQGELMAFLTGHPSAKPHCPKHRDRPATQTWVSM